jgi:coenzyme Q-binding protein COQ10
MKKFHISILTNHQPKDIYDLVLDIEKYPEFLPWCLAIRVIEKKHQNITADMLINFKGITYQFRSDIVHNSDNDLYIDVKQQNGPFKYMHNRWEFTQLNNNQAKIDFSIEFEFSSLVLNKLSGLFLDNAVEKITNAFMKRADIIYHTKPKN